MTTLDDLVRAAGRYRVDLWAIDDYGVWDTENNMFVSILHGEARLAKRHAARLNLAGVLRLLMGDENDTLGCIGRRVVDLQEILEHDISPKAESPDQGPGQACPTRASEGRTASGRGSDNP